MQRASTGGLTRIARGLRLLTKLVEGLLLVGLVFPHLRPPQRDRIIEQWSRDVLDGLAVRLVRRGAEPPATVSSVLFAANHVSWLDILVMSAIRRVRFVAKAEVRRWPIVGWLAARTGTIFLRRDSHRELARATKVIGASLRQGRCVALFPEGTTTDGTATRPFRSGLFEAAVSADALVWPVAIAYCGPEGSLDDAAAFVGDQSLVSSIWKVLCRPGIDAHLTFAEPLAGSAGNRRELATRCRDAIDESLSTHARPLGLPRAPRDELFPPLTAA